uniref:hypothetical protein n=1 Tax=Amycolatopsis sp. CA-151526 TaxID=3239921 RepID=UPI003F49A868
MSDDCERADHVYRDGAWVREDTEIFDPAEDDPDLQWSTRLERSGWEHAMQVGEFENNDGVRLSVYFHLGRKQYLIQVDMIYGFEALLIVHRVPDLLDVLGRWAPAARLSVGRSS